MTVDITGKWVMKWDGLVGLQISASSSVWFEALFEMEELVTVQVGQGE